MIRKETFKVINISGIDITLKRKAVKNIYLRISNVTADVVVTVPYYMPVEQIDNFLRSKADWIKKNVASIQSRHIEKPEYTAGKDHVWLWGSKYNIRFLPGTEDIITIHGEELQVYSRKVLSEVGKSKIVDSYCRKILQAEISRLLDHWQTVMGLQAEGFAVRKMKSRWGSCHVLKKFIIFNYGLVYRPRMCLEYVVVHELAHLYEASHNQKFKSFLTAFLPDWQSRRKLLNNFSFNYRDNENLL